jgi:hypothetical protein
MVMALPLARMARSMTLPLTMSAFGVGEEPDDVRGTADLEGLVEIRLLCRHFLLLTGFFDGILIWLIIFSDVAKHAVRLIQTAILP